MYGQSLSSIFAGQPKHIIRRGNNCGACFLDKKDYQTYLYYLKGYSAKNVKDKGNEN
ncbi:hypothetical protein TDB9533_00490 [Thalassocella blandensis]|nr:hypothetical protein TDB9533_00490 [Thalassocella blandensis]